MAASFFETGTLLQVKFKDADEKDILFLIKYADPGCSSSDILTFVQSVLTNGDIFKKVPVRFVGAKTITISENIYSL